MKFLFINPPNQKRKNDVNKAVVPLALAYLASVLLKDKHEVKILDSVIEDINNEFKFNKTEYFGLDLKKIKSEIERNNPDVVGVSCLFTTVYEISIEICRIAKECNIKYTLIGGPTPSALIDLFASKSYIDFVFLGESENSISEFAQVMVNGNGRQLKDIDGIAYKGPDNQIVVQKKKNFISNLDDIPFPARHLLPMEKYFKVSSPHGAVYKSKRNTPIMTSRGCTAKCNFCASTNVWGNRYRYRSADNVIEELKHLKREYKIEEFQLFDDNFTFNKKRTIEICNRLKGMKMHWSMPNGLALWALDEERIKAMSESGCHYVIVAIESGNQRVLREVIRKPLKLSKALEMCECIKRYKISLSGFFIIGFPDETLEEIRDTYKFALKCNLEHASFAYATPLPSSRLWQQAERENLFIKKFDLTNIIYDKPSLKSRNWAIDELQSLVLQLNREFYLKTFLKNPRIIFFHIINALKRSPMTLIKIIYYRLIGKL